QAPSFGGVVVGHRAVGCAGELHHAQPLVDLDDGDCVMPVVLVIGVQVSTLSVQDVQGVVLGLEHLLDVLPQVGGDVGGSAAVRVGEEPPFGVLVGDGVVQETLLDVLQQTGVNVGGSAVLVL